MGYLMHLGGCFGRCWLEEGCPGGHLLAFGPTNLQKTIEGNCFVMLWGCLGCFLAPRWAPRCYLGCTLDSIFGALGLILGAFFNYFLHGLPFKKHRKTMGFLRFFNVLGVGWAT